MSVFDPSFGELFSASSPGYWIENSPGGGGDGDLDLDQSFCFYFTRHDIDGEDLAVLGTVRARVAASKDLGPDGLPVPWPATITVGVGREPEPE